LSCLLDLAMIWYYICHVLLAKILKLHKHHGKTMYKTKTGKHPHL
jgi:hypothetical protein